MSGGLKTKWCPDSADLLQGIPDGHCDIASTVSTQVFVDLLKASDPFGNLLAGVGAAGRLAEVRPASKGTSLIDHAARGERMQQGACPIIPLGEFLPSRGADRLGCRERFALGENGGSSRQMKAAAFGLQGTVPLGRIRLELGIDLADAGYGLFCVTSGIGGLVGITFAHEKRKI